MQGGEGSACIYLGPRDICMRYFLFRERHGRKWVDFVKKYSGENFFASENGNFRFLDTEYHDIDDNIIEVVPKILVVILTLSATRLFFIRYHMKIGMFVCANYHFFLVKRKQYFLIYLFKWLLGYVLFYKYLSQIQA